MRQIQNPEKPAPYVPPLTADTIERYGEPDPQPGNYYVTARDGGRNWFLLGPLAHHEVALRMVARVKELAHEADGYSVFYSYGTARCADTKPGSANKYCPEAFAEDAALTPSAMRPAP